MGISATVKCANLLVAFVGDVCCVLLALGVLAALVRRVLVAELLPSL